MNRPPPRWREAEVVDASATRSVRLTLARIGLRSGSKTSSVIESCVTRTGTIRLRLQTKSASGVSVGRDLELPAVAWRVLPLELRRGRMHQRLERGERREEAGLDRVGVLVGELELVGGVELGLERDRLDGRPLQPQRLRAVGLVAAPPAPASERCSVSEAYCSAMIRTTAPLSGSISTSPAVASFGERGSRSWRGPRIAAAEEGEGRRAQRPRGGPGR